MLAYAFKVLRQDNFSKVSTEEFENIHNLFASILSKGIAQQLKQGLYREYINQKENLSVMRGKLDIVGTVKNKVQQKSVLSCDYDDFSEDNIYNQILKATATLLINHRDVKTEYRNELKKLMLYFGNVHNIEISVLKWSTLRFHRNNYSYKMLMNICYLIIDGMIISDKYGKKLLAQFIDDQHMHALYENFIREYYRYHFKSINVSAAYVDWDVSSDSEGIEFLPKMKTDITLQKDGKVLIIDAKYYSKTMQHHYNSQTFHSTNMYQIFTYVKNWDKEKRGNVSGMLLYAKTDESIQPNNSFIIGGNQISVKTLDLNTEFFEISKQLNDIVRNYFKCNC